ncbi:hypothetical protein [Streptomyces bullii]|uniref:Uncharacterized protein n=1 Tax=Streptomyces bullii TaxID=349910 RepID=A0ABW0UX29_9ACTN
MFLFLLVVLARADTLRHRELYADLGAVALGADPGVWRAGAKRAVAQGAWSLTEVLVQTAAPAMFGAALVAPLARLPRGERPSAHSEAVRRSWSIRIAVGVVAVLAVMSSVVAVRS